MRGLKRAREGENDEGEPYHHQQTNQMYWTQQLHQMTLEETQREIKKLRVGDVGWDTANGPEHQSQAYTHAQSSPYASTTNGHGQYPQHMQNPYLPRDHMQSASTSDFTKLQPFRISTRTVISPHPYAVSQNPQPQQTPYPPTPPHPSADAIATAYDGINQYLHSIHVARHGDPEQYERWWENEAASEMNGNSHPPPTVSGPSAASQAAQQYNHINSLLREAFLQRRGGLPN